jgi:hypothetical protein
MGSDEDTTDGGTGKGSAEQVAAIFRKSKKVIRTPTKGKEKSQEDKMDKILRMLGNLNNEMKEMREEQKEYRQEVRELRKENEKIKRENMELKQKIEEVEKKMDRMEKEKRRNNIIVQGIEMKTQDQNAIKEKLTSFLERALQIKIDIINAKKIKEGMCLVELRNETDKGTVMKNKAKLKEIKEPRVYINDDMSKIEREIQKKIRIRAKEERAEGSRVKIGFQKLMVNEEEWKWDIERQRFEKDPGPGKLQKN